MDCKPDFERRKRPDRLHRTPARLDFMQSATGVILALFIAGHLVFEASIILGKDAMYAMTRFFEGYYFFGEPYPIIITFLAAGIFAVFITHALIAMRKFPADYRQYKVMNEHVGRFKHTDTSLWLLQIWTGFAMFFLGSVHLYMMMSAPADIGPYASSDRIVSGWLWPLYVMLIISVVIHAAIGVYRLSLKWGWFEGKNSKKSRLILRRVTYAVMAGYLLLSFTSLATYVKIGIEHADSVGERYHPVETVMEAGE